MLKVCGLLLVLGGCILWGFRAAEGLSARVRVLEELAFAVQALERELSLFRPSLPVLLERMAQGRSEQVACILNNCRAEVEKGNCFTDVWEIQQQKLPLTGQERGLVRGLGQVLGQYDDKGQVQAAVRIPYR